MAVLRLRRAAQLTLPAEVRDALRLKEGDYLEARIVGDGVLLKPVSMVARQRAWAGVQRAVSSVQDRKRGARATIKAEEEAIAREVKRVRRTRAKRAG
jgi:AbrB family looped-hinge helix DNA binding protein